MEIQLMFFAVILSAAHFFGQRIDIKAKGLIAYLRSFSAGVSISYLFLVLLPELFRVSNTDSIPRLFLPVALGVTAYHVVTRLAANRSNGKKRSILYERVHLAALVVANFATSYLALSLIAGDVKVGVILVAVLSVHYLFMDIVANKITSESDWENSAWDLSLAVTPLVAGALVITGAIATVANATLFGFAIGTVLYTTLHEEIPPEKEGNPLLFALGVGVIIALAYSII